jgi:hypothetical protein
VGTGDGRWSTHDTEATHQWRVMASQMRRLMLDVVPFSLIRIDPEIYIVICVQSFLTCAPYSISYRDMMFQDFFLGSLSVSC